MQNNQRRCGEQLYPQELFHAALGVFSTEYGTPINTVELQSSGYKNSTNEAMYSYRNRYAAIFQSDNADVFHVVCFPMVYPNEKYHLAPQAHQDHIQGIVKEVKIITSDIRHYTPNQNDIDLQYTMLTTPINSELKIDSIDDNDEVEQRRINCENNTIYYHYFLMQSEQTHHYVYVNVYEMSNDTQKVCFHGSRLKDKFYAGNAKMLEEIKNGHEKASGKSYDKNNHVPIQYKARGDKNDPRQNQKDNWRCGLFALVHALEVVNPEKYETEFIVNSGQYKSIWSQALAIIPKNRFSERHPASSYIDKGIEYDDLQSRKTDVNHLDDKECDWPDEDKSESDLLQSSILKNRVNDINDGNNTFSNRLNILDDTTELVDSVILEPGNHNQRYCHQTRMTMKNLFLKILQC